MRRALLPLIAASLAASACAHRAPKSEPSPEAVAAVKARADAAAGAPAAKPAPKDEVALAAPTGTSAPQPEGPQKGEATVRKGKILGKDPEGCTWLEGEATVVAGDNDTVQQTRAAGVEQARAAAVQDFLGVDVNSKFMDFQQEGLRHQSQLVESILQTTRNGRILKEQVLDSGFVQAADCRSCYRVRLKACVLPKDEKADKDFRVELQLSRTRFVQGDEAKIAITATRDCSVYLYDVYDLGAQDKTALVVPNEAVPFQTLKAGVPWEYPDEEAKKRGVRLVAELPKRDDAVSAETIRVVATKTPLPPKVYDPTDGGYLGVLRRLNRSKTEWSEDAEAYTIYQR